MWYILLWLGLAFIVASFVTIHLVVDVRKQRDQVEQQFVVTCRVTKQQILKWLMVKGIKLSS